MHSSVSPVELGLGNPRVALGIPDLNHSMLAEPQRTESVPRKANQCTDTLKHLVQPANRSIQTSVSYTAARAIVLLEVRVKM